MATVCGRAATAAAQSRSSSPCATCKPSRQVNENHAARFENGASASNSARASSREGSLEDRLLSIEKLCTALGPLRVISGIKYFTYIRTCIKECAPLLFK